MNISPKVRYTAALVFSPKRFCAGDAARGVSRLQAITWWPPASKEEIHEHIENTDFDVIILNHTLSFADRKALARKAKQRNPNNGVLVLHHSGSLGNPYVDLAVDSRAGVKPCWIP